MTKTCLNCKYCLLVDDGYSNWTVEGTTVICTKDRQEPFDRWYGSDQRINFAEKCKKYSNGEPERLDVERGCYNDLSKRAKKYV